MKKHIYYLSVMVLAFTSCHNEVDELIGVDPNDNTIKLKHTEFKKEGERWVPILNGDTLIFNWTSSPTQSEEPISSKFGPGSYSISANSVKLNIGKSGSFQAKDGTVFFYSYHNLTGVSVLVDSAKYNLEGDFFFLKQKENEVKFQILKGEYTP